ncbi:heme/hemin ABC transporter substrate-binding protein [Gallaecimonas xiamenensis]|uniref:Periplasmic binding protein n=1 Tax=Gallaecimonas xiamenensis 3-C-1 TaxID=745411 RepID=K2JX93_9GAMM|nr:ABC transporter substrate-binding protein [Gallaecimonas xiamenensis]EKE69870.1 periplasmic binding protein [Gallaecimonas xiamenensis 3-C-1]
MTRLLGLLLLPTLAWAQPKLVTTGASVTQIVQALGGDTYIVGTDSTSPGEHPKLGYFRQLGAEGVLSLAPTEIWAAPGTGPASVLAQLADSGIRVRQLPAEPGLEGLFNHIQTLGQWLDKPDRAEALVTQIQAGLAALPPLAGKPKALFLLGAGERGLTAAGAQTWPDTLMTLAGIDNLAASQNGYKAFSREMLLAGVDLILVPEHLSSDPQALCQSPPLDILGPRCHVRALPADLVMSQGPAVVEAVKAIRHALP